MKTITTILLLLTFIGLKAQEKFSAGITVEGLSSNPQNLNYDFSNIDSGLGTGIGIFFSTQIWKSLSANSGISYRFLRNDYSHERTTTQDPYGTVGTGVFDQYKYKQSFLVVPINLRYNLLNNWLFIEPGAELSWVLNRGNRRPNNDMMWKIGLGSKIGELNYSLNYLWGSKEQNDVFLQGTRVDGLRFKSRMIQFKVSYPLWNSKAKK